MEPEAQANSINTISPTPEVKAETPTPPISNNLEPKKGNSKKVLIIILIIALLLLCICSVCGIGMFFMGGQVTKDITFDSTVDEDGTDYPFDDNFQDNADDFDIPTPKPTVGGQLDIEGQIPAPSGFEWYLCKNMNTYFLRPNNWFVLEESSSNSQGCFISKEEIVSGGNFKTGLTVNFVEDVEAISGVSADDYAFKFIDELRSKYQNSEYFEDKNLQQNMYSAILEVNDGDFPITAYYNAIVTNQKQGFYIVIFESPTQSWDSEWEKTGKQIIGNMGFVE
ncbi:hypothetical protein KBD45_03860 [Candidatus Dojkabacteria bacterium]|nr:hypothetical protein [Candidatus Dojkabacteria bacterium]